MLMIALGTTGNGWTWLKMAKHVWKGWWKSLKFLNIAIFGWKKLEMAENGW